MISRHLRPILCTSSLFLVGCSDIHAQSTESPPRVLTEHQLNEEFRNGRRSFINVAVAERWNGGPLTSVNDTPVLFQNCYFLGGIEFTNLRIAGPVSFDSCAFGPSPVITSAPRGGSIHCPLPDFPVASFFSRIELRETSTRPRDNLIQSCYVSDTIRFRRCSFYWDTRLYDTVFSGLFTIEGCCYDKKLHIERCSFASRFRVANVKFNEGLVIEGTDFNNSIDVADSEFVQLFELQKVHISGDLILESSSIRNSGLTNSPDKAVLRLIDTIIAGELNADHFVFKEPNKESSKLVIHECTIADIRGINWSQFHEAFESADPENEAEVLAQLRHSFLQFGQITDAGKTLLAIKANEANTAGGIGYLVDWVMRYTSGWGTKPSLLMWWFMGIVLVFMTWYLILVIASFGCNQIPSVLIECFVLSVSVTLLQNDPDDVRELCKDESTPRATTLQRKLRKLIRFQKIIGTVFLMVVGGYIGSTLSNS